MNHADAVGHGIVKGTDADLVALQKKRAFGGRFDTGENLRQGGFAGAVLTHQCVNLSPKDIEVDLVQSHGTGKNFSDLFSSEDDIVMDTLAHPGLLLYFKGDRRDANQVGILQLGEGTIKRDALAHEVVAIQFAGDRLVDHFVKGVGETGELKLVCKISKGDEFQRIADGAVLDDRSDLNEHIGRAVGRIQIHINGGSSGGRIYGYDPARALYPDNSRGCLQPFRGIRTDGRRLPDP